MAPGNWKLAGLLPKRFVFWGRTNRGWFPSDGGQKRVGNRSSVGEVKRQTDGGQKRGGNGPSGGGKRNGGRDVAELLAVAIGNGGGGAEGNGGRDVAELLAVAFVRLLREGTNGARIRVIEFEALCGKYYNTSNYYCKKYSTVGTRSCFLYISQSQPVMYLCCLQGVADMSRRVVECTDEECRRQIGSRRGRGRGSFVGLLCQRGQSNSRGIQTCAPCIAQTEGINTTSIMS